MLALFKSFISGFSQLLTSIVSLIKFVIHAVTSLVVFISNLPRYITFATTSLNILPTVIIPFAVAGLSIYFVLRLINREVG